MARKKTPTLTEVESKLMNIVWELGEATVTEVVQALPEENRPAYNTVLTTMRILEDKGYLGHKKIGRAHVYQPLITRDKAQGQVVRHMVRSFFDGSPEMLMMSILKNEKLTPEEIERLKELIRKHE